MREIQQVQMVHLGGSHLALARGSDDVRGMVVVDQNGYRVGEVEDLVIDAQERRARLLVVVSGGLAGLRASRRLIPVETVARVDDRVRIGRTCLDHRTPGSVTATEREDISSISELYARYDVLPFWDAARSPVYFHLR
jgi:sporulation protein YlmC with PRC-barrel domain